MDLTLVRKIFEKNGFKVTQNNPLDEPATTLRIEKPGRKPMFLRVRRPEWVIEGYVDPAGNPLIFQGTGLEALELKALWLKD